METELENGILIKKQDYDDYDEIITILYKDNLIVILALGVRKITSKNRNALQLGNIINISYFKARLVNKISKLKKATIEFQPEIEKSDSSDILLDILYEVNKVENPTKEIYKAYLESISFLGKEWNWHIKTYVYCRILTAYGLYPNFLGCTTCGRKDRIIDFQWDAGGFICFYHSKFEKDIDFLNGIKNLSISFDKYMEISPEINKKIFIELNKYFGNYARY